MLTEREKWLMRKAYAAAQHHIYNMDDWLFSMVADGVTVEMVLAKEAPTHHGRGEK